MTATDLIAYKGFVAFYEWYDVAKVYVGSLDLPNGDTISICGKNIEDLHQSFMNAIDKYLSKS